MTKLNITTAQAATAQVLLLAAWGAQKPGEVPLTLTARGVSISVEPHYVESSCACAKEHIITRQYILLPGMEEVEFSKEDIGPWPSRGVRSGRKIA